MHSAHENLMGHKQWGVSICYGYWAAGAKDRK